jgi:hypothetical protein
LFQQSVPKQLFSNQETLQNNRMQSPSESGPTTTRGRTALKRRSTIRSKSARGQKHHKVSKGKLESVRKWIRVHRPPGNNPKIQFTVATWVPLDDLTDKEKEQYVSPDVLQQMMLLEDEDAQQQQQQQPLSMTAATTPSEYSEPPSMDTSMHSFTDGPEADEMVPHVDSTKNSLFSDAQNSSIDALSILEPTIAVGEPQIQDESARADILKVEPTLVQHEAIPEEDSLPHAKRQRTEEPDSVGEPQMQDESVKLDAFQDEPTSVQHESIQEVDSSPPAKRHRAEEPDVVNQDILFFDNGIIHPAEPEQ